MRENPNNTSEPVEKLKSDEQPAVYAVHKTGGSTRFTRRDFLAAAGATGAAVVILGCGTQARVIPTSTPRPTNTPLPSPTAKPDTVEPVVLKLDSCQGMLADKNSIYQLYLAGDGKSLAAYSFNISSRESRVKLWTLPERALIKTLEGVSAVTFSPDSQTLAVGGVEAIELLSLPDGEVIKTIPDAYGEIYEIYYSPDGKLLVTAGGSKIIRIRSMPDGELLKELESPVNEIFNLAFSPDGKLLGAAGDHDSVCIWSVPDGELLHMLTGHDDAAYRIAFTPDSSRLVTVGAGGLVKLWSLPDGTVLSETKDAFQFALSVDGKFLASRRENTYIDLITTEDGKVVKSWAANPNGIIALLFSPDDSLLVTTGESPEIKLWSIPDGQMVRQLDGHTQEIYCVVFSPDGQTLYSGGRDQTINVWNLDGEITGCLIDLADTPPDFEGITYTKSNAAGQMITYTLPCGSPIPEGAICTCNCVAGMGTPICSCVGDICSCVGDTSGYLVYWYPN